MLYTFIKEKFVHITYNNIYDTIKYKIISLRLGVFVCFWNEFERNTNTSLRPFEKNVSSFSVFFRLPLRHWVSLSFSHLPLSPAIKLYYAVDLRDSIRESAFWYIIT